MSSSEVTSDVRELIERRAHPPTCEVLALPVLVLNRVFEPVRITTAAPLPRFNGPA